MFCSTAERQPTETRNRTAIERKEKEVPKAIKILLLHLAHRMSLIILAVILLGGCASQSKLLYPAEHQEAEKILSFYRVAVGLRFEYEMAEQGGILFKQYKYSSMAGLDMLEMLNHPTDQIRWSKEPALINHLFHKGAGQTASGEEYDVHYRNVPDPNRRIMLCVGDYCRHLPCEEGLCSINVGQAKAQVRWAARTLGCNPHHAWECSSEAKEGSEEAQP